MPKKQGVEINEILRKALRLYSEVQLSQYYCLVKLLPDLSQPLFVTPFSTSPYSNNIPSYLKCLLLSIIQDVFHSLPCRIETWDNSQVF